MRAKMCYILDDGLAFTSKAARRLKKRVRRQIKLQERGMFKALAKLYQKGAL